MKSSFIDVVNSDLDLGIKVTSHCDREYFLITVSNIEIKTPFYFFLSDWHLAEVEEAILPSEHPSRQRASADVAAASSPTSALPWERASSRHHLQQLPRRPRIASRQQTQSREQRRPGSQRRLLLRMRQPWETISFLAAAEAPGWRPAVPAVPVRAKQADTSSSNNNRTRRSSAWLESAERWTARLTAWQERRRLLEFAEYKQ